MHVLATTGVFTAAAVLQIGLNLSIIHSLRGRHKPAVSLSASPIVHAACALCINGAVIAMVAWAAVIRDDGLCGNITLF